MSVICEECSRPSVIDAARMRFALLTFNCTCVRFLSCMYALVDDQSASSDTLEGASWLCAFVGGGFRHLG